MSDIKLNDVSVDFSNLDLSYLTKEKWDYEYITKVKNSPIVTMESFNMIISSPSSSYTEVRINYDSLDNRLSPTSFVNIANWAGIMDNIKAGVPRTAYRGIVTCYKNNIKLHIAPIDL